MTNGSGVTASDNVVKEGVTVKVTFGKDLKFRREQAFEGGTSRTGAGEWGRRKKHRGPDHGGTW